MVCCTEVEGWGVETATGGRAGRELLNNEEGQKNAHSVQLKFGEAHPNSRFGPGYNQPTFGL